MSKYKYIKIITLIKPIFNDILINKVNNNMLLTHVIFYKINISHKYSIIYTWDII